MCVAVRRGVWRVALIFDLVLVLLQSSDGFANELIIPSLEYRTGSFSSSGIPLWSGFTDYLTLLNERDGGINGVKIKIAACETAYDTKRGVECYEKLKQGALAIVAGSTGIAYELIPRAAADRIPILSPGYGRTATADGRVFPWVFNFPATYWSAASIIMNFIAERETGSAKLRGKKIALLYLDNPYGREPLPVLEELARRQAFALIKYPVAAPGVDQRAVWEKVSRDQPDWILLWTYGAMSQVAISSAAVNRFPMDHVIGNWWASGENDVAITGAAANGYLGAALHAPGAVCPVHEDLFKFVYDAGKAIDPSSRSRVGEVLYNRGLSQAMWIAEGIAKAMSLRKRRDITSTDVRDGLEALDISEERIEQLGFEGMLSPMRITCSNHEGTGKAAIQQWDGVGLRWRLVSGFHEPDRGLIEPLLKSDSEKYARENNIAIRDCR